MTITWHPSYLTGVKVIDGQHQTLVKQANYLEQLHENNCEGRVFRQAMQDLVAFLRHHFRQEETLLAEKHCPDDHAREHQELIGQMQQHLVDYERRGHIASQDFVQWLHAWLPEHLSGSDRVFAQDIFQS